MVKKYLNKIEKMKGKIPALKNEIFESASSGTHHNVFLSQDYVIRFRENNQEILSREAGFLKQFNHPLIPKIVWIGKTDKSVAMIEKRLQGVTIDTTWENMPKAYQARITDQIIEFLQYLKTQNKDYVYSVKTGKKYEDFFEYLIDDIKQKIDRIKKFKQADKILLELLTIVNDPKSKNLFSNAKIATIHGDLIIHNLLTDKENLTGVLDWELALFGDPDHDLFRLFYYGECAKAYHEQGIDEKFESLFMDTLIQKILDSDLIKDKALFNNKFNFTRAIFYLNALHWAVNSISPIQNIDEIISLWNKKSGAEA